MKVVVIGGSGKVGTYLVPMMVQRGYAVTVVSRSMSEPYIKDIAWKKVDRVLLDRQKMDNDNTFAKAIAALEPDIVIDLVCFTAKSLKFLADELIGKVQHYLVAGSIWSQGYFVTSPTIESDERNPICEYGKNKNEMCKMIKKLATTMNFPGTILHFGHIVGTGHAPLNPVGNKDFSVWRKLMDGKEVKMLNYGLETVHHVHAYDLAKLFLNCIDNRSNSIGEDFWAVSEAALTLRGFAEEVAKWFDQKANLKLVNYNEFKKDYSEAEANTTYDHVLRSSCMSIEKAKRLVGYNPKFTSLEAVRESLMWLIANKSF